MAKILAIIKNETELDRILPKCPSDLIILNLSGDNLDKKLKAKTKNDYINESKLLNEIHGKIRDMSFNWPVSRLNEIKKIAIYDGIPLLYCTCLHFELVLREIIVYVELIKKVLETEKPDLIYTVNSNDYLSKIIITTLTEFKTNHEIIEDGIFFKIQNKIKINSKFFAGRYLKPIVLDNYLKLKYANKTKLPIKDKNKKIMFFSYLNLDPQIMVPIIKKLQGTNQDFLVFALALDVQEAFVKNNIPFSTFADYDLSNIKRKISQKKKDLKRIWEILDEDKKFMYDNINLWHCLRDEFYYTVFKHFYEVIRLIEGIKIVIKEEEVKVILMGSDVHRFGKTVALMANKTGVNSLVIQHGVAGILGFVPVTCTKIAVWGESSKKFLLQNNVPKEKIMITGATKFDAIINTKYDRESIIKEFGLDKSKKIIMLGTQTVPEKEEMFNCVINGLSDEQLIIKLHPKDDLEFYNSRLANLNFKNKIVVIKDYDLYKILSITDLTISRASSTVVIESMLFNIPIITLNLANIKGGSEMVDYEDYRCVIEVKNQDEIKKAINNVFYNKKIQEKLYKNMKKFIKDYAYNIDGKSTDRIINLIENLSKK